MDTPALPLDPPVGFLALLVPPPVGEGSPALDFLPNRLIFWVLGSRLLLASTCHTQRQNALLASDYISRGISSRGIKSITDQSCLQGCDSLVRDSACARESGVLFTFVKGSSDRSAN
jgi:hypothetical protein